MHPLSIELAPPRQCEKAAQRVASPAAPLISIAASFRRHTCRTHVRLKGPRVNEAQLRRARQWPRSDSSSHPRESRPLEPRASLAVSAAQKFGPRDCLGAPGDSRGRVTVYRLFACAAPRRFAGVLISAAPRERRSLEVDFFLYLLCGSFVII